MLRGLLDYHRATLAMTCDRLTDAGLRQQSMPPSTLPRHVLLEYGRHNGHADFLREGVDGTVGA